MEWKALWIRSDLEDTNAVPEFFKNFSIKKPVKKAVLYVTSLGVYEAELNGQRVGDYIMAPGWTVYKKRLQYQTYDVTSLLKEDNDLVIRVGRGWYSSPLGWTADKKEMVRKRPKALLAELYLTDTDGKETVIRTDRTWSVRRSNICFSEIYDGEVYDASFNTESEDAVKAKEYKYGYETLIPQEGEIIREVERVFPVRVFTTKEGDTMVDFGQEVTGYVEFTVNAHAGDKVHLYHSEVMDKKGNFYNENYRSAAAELTYTCADGLQTYHPHLTFYGFRYIKVAEWPGGPENIKAEQFSAIVVHSDMKRTGYINTSSPMLNQLISNALWSQRGNFLDVPTDCPQRDERLGWTGDAEIFSRTAGYNYDTRKFYRKWIHDVAADQDKEGMIPHVVPNVLDGVDMEKAGTEFKPTSGCGWADCITIIPWTVYRTYGDRTILRDAFPAMKKYIDYIGTITKDQYLWTGCFQFGDWLGLDAEPGSYKGKSDDDLVASAFYAYTVSLLIKTGKVLKKDMSAYEDLYDHIVKAFRKRFPEYRTQSEHVLALQFGLAKNPKKTAKALAELVEKDGCMKTGFLGTPFLLHVLSDNGYTELAYQLLLREKYPSWLYPITKGATTIWEHWDGIMPNGNMWSPDLNSFNHYSYGSVLDWMYEKACGIRMPEETAGFEEIRIEPQPSKQLQFMEASIDTVRGKISSRWAYVGSRIRYDITIPAEGEIIIKGICRRLPAGSYTFWN